MNESELRQTIAKNITRLRKLSNLTQAELAEKLSYSDKSISKWERGDGLPDIYILTQIAELFGVTVNDLICDKPQIQPEKATQHEKRNRRLLITALSSGLVWFIATLVYFFLKVFIPEATWMWMSFVFAIPVSAIVVLVFVHKWWGIIPQALSVSALAWGIAVSIHTVAIDFNVRNMPFIYTATAAFQVLVVLWYLYRWNIKKHASKTEGNHLSCDAAQVDNTIADNQIEKDRLLNTVNTSPEDREKAKK